MAKTDTPAREPHTTVWYLKQNKLFEFVGDDVLASCDALFTQVPHPKRTRLFDQGDAAGRIFFLKRGRVRLDRVTDEGKEITIALLGPGDIFGEEALFGQPVRRTIATCVDDALVCTSSAEQLFPMLRRYPTLMMNVARFLSEQREEAVSAMEELAFLKVPERIARLLQRLAEEHGIPDPAGTRIGLKLTHADIAALVGSTRETVTLELGNLQRDGRLIVRRRDLILPPAAPVA